jgi:ADP-ribose pyrophosphatase YjhB (NUDIX family)
MEIKSTISWRGKNHDLVYRDIDSIDELENRKVSAVHAWCFCGDKIVIVYAKKKDIWTPPGGGVEDGENCIDAMIREVREETNMKVLKWRFVGYQDVYEPGNISTQVRFVCIVEPYGDFVEDPDEGDITEIRLIGAKDFNRQYFNWGEIGDHITKRALEMKAKMLNE